MSTRRCIAASGTGTFQNTSAFVRGEPSNIVRALKLDRHAGSRVSMGRHPRSRRLWNACWTKLWAAAAGWASLASPGHPTAAPLQPCASRLVLMRICLFIWKSYRERRRDEREIFHLPRDLDQACWQRGAGATGSGPIFKYTWNVHGDGPYSTT